MSDVKSKKKGTTKKPLKIKKSVLAEQERLVTEATSAAALEAARKDAEKKKKEVNTQEHTHNRTNESDERTLTMYGCALFSFLRSLMLVLVIRLVWLPPLRVRDFILNRSSMPNSSMRVRRISPH